MKFTFYSKPGCPQCKVLKMKMDAAGIQYTHIEDIDAIIALGYQGAPVLVTEVGAFVGPNAIKWINNWIKEHPNGH